MLVRGVRWIYLRETEREREPWWRHQIDVAYSHVDLQLFQSSKIEKCSITNTRQWVAIQAPVSEESRTKTSETNYISVL